MSNCVISAFELGLGNRMLWRKVQYKLYYFTFIRFDKAVYAFIKLWNRGTFFMFLNPYLKLKLYAVGTRKIHLTLTIVLVPTT